MNEDFLMNEEKQKNIMKSIVNKLRENKPSNFDEAYNNPDEKLREKWRNSLRKELRKMINQGVYRKRRRRDIPTGRKCVKCKWVFEIKRNGIFRSQLVACGYSQVPGIDFTESYAPVINDITWRILIIIKMIFGYNAKIVDVETAFLYGNLDEQIFMDCPPGMEHEEHKCLELNKSIYGLVQAARQYYLKFTQVLRNIGFIGGNADPCLFKRQDKNGTVFIAIWVDDSLLIGDDSAIEATIKDLRNAGFNLKIEGSLDDYLSCEISMNENNTKGWIHQPHLLKKLELKFGRDVEKLQDYTTPGTPGISTLRDAELTVSKEEHKYYRSGVGMLLYLVKHTRPDIANAV